MSGRLPLPWSFSALDKFDNCPFDFAEVKVFKRVRESDSEHNIWGLHVHKQFELRQGPERVPLHQDLRMHEPFMQELDAIPGRAEVEQKVALTKALKPCAFFAKDVWYRGVIDWRKIDGEHAVIVDYKTGKIKPKYKQLALFAIHTFVEQPQVNRIIVKFYWAKFWNQADCITQRVYTRDQLPALWKEFVPSLKQYVEAFKTNTWQKRPNGLCNGWCAVQHCEHWKPKRV